MQIEVVSPTEYDQFFREALCFQQAAFNELNKRACDQIIYFIFRDKKVRLGLIAGLRDNGLFSPFSAPFGGFSTNDKKIQVPYIEESLELMESYCVDNLYNSWTITLPPLFYNPSFLTKLIEVFNRKSWLLSQLDLDYYYDLKQIKPEIILDTYSYNARKNLKTAQKHAFSIEIGQEHDHLEAAYSIIKVNRQTKGYDLKLSLIDFQKTAEIIPIDCFVVKLDQAPVASAIVYTVSPTICQVVYWGDLPDFAASRTMNYLAYEVFQFYARQGLQFIDIGTSMIQNRPNYGLCEFKESIGNQINPKFTFHKEWKQ
jgi:lipid II:glycine glycyltransferase (peptidoglycan interpeptide bridge formation enzyme)